ncbi:MAG TPA: hypothetical protein GX525_12020 [Bacilli bacterium]|nr:hypothetical protein [Bacilli bacterium]
MITSNDWYSVVDVSATDVFMIYATVIGACVVAGVLCNVLINAVRGYREWR